MNFTWKHPSKYKRIPRDKAISSKESTDSEERAPNVKQQASSDKQQAATIIEGDKKDE
jgi:hypothetical protein